MAITHTIDMKYTRSGEATESDVLSAHNPLIWEFQDGAIAPGPGTATVDIVVKNNAGTTIYTSDTFSAYLLDYTNPIAKFRFDATQIIKHIINNYFYKETSEVVEPENYGSEIEVTFKSYDNAVLEDTELLEYFACHAVNQIGDEYGTNIPRMFYNDTEEIAHFLGFPNHLFFYSKDDISAHSPLVEIIERGVTEYTNLISSLTNAGYDTFIVVATAVTSAIELGFAGIGKSDTFAVTSGQNYLIIIPAFVNNAGELPEFRLVEITGFTTISNELRVVVGDNAFILKATSTVANAQLWFRNGNPADWSCGDIQVKPVQDASDEGTLKIFVHSIDLNQLVLSKESILAKVYYDLDDPILLKTYNLTVYEHCENAVYVRFLTSDGYYMYWAFSSYPYTTKSGDKIGNVINNFSEMALANSRNIPIGYKNSFNKMAVIASAVPITFRRKLLELFTSPAVYLWDGKETLGENLISEFSDYGTYETFTFSGLVITSAIETGVSGAVSGNGNGFEVTQGEQIIVMFDLNTNSGQTPRLRLNEYGTVIAISNIVASAAGFNLITLTATKTAKALLRIYNTAAANFSTSAIIVKRKEIELDWILLEKVEGSHELKEKMDSDNFECTLVLPENYTQTLSGQNL